MKIYIEVQITESEAREAYQSYVEERWTWPGEPLDYEEFKAVVLADYISDSLDENCESVTNYLEGDWLKIEEE